MFETIIPHASKLVVDAERTASFRDLDVDGLSKFVDPWKIDAKFLPWLAYRFSVDLWNDDWSETKKRDVIAQQYDLHRLKGTEEGIRRMLDIVDADILRIVAPPQGFIIGPDLTKEEMDAYVERHPKVRITMQEGVGLADDDEAFVDFGFIDLSFIPIDDSHFLRGRRAYLSKGGVETPILISAISTEAQTKTAVVTERVTVPGLDTFDNWIGEMGPDLSFIEAEEKPPESYTVNFDRNYIHSESSLDLSLIEIGYQPRDVRYKRESLIGEMGPYIFIAASTIGEDFIGPDDASYMLADVIHLFDPSIEPPVTIGGGFIGVDRIGMPPHTADLQIDWNMKEPAEGKIFGIIGDSFIDVSYIADDDEDRRDLLFYAVRASKRLSDDIYVTFQTHKPRTLKDGIPLDGSFQFGDLIRTYI